MGPPEQLEAARSSAAAGRWEEARAQYAAAAAADGAGEAYDGLGRVCWWLGDVRSAIRHRERAFTCYHKEDRTDDAARVAVDLGIWYLTNLDNDAAAQGWLARAARCAEGTRDDALRGWVILVGAYLSGDPRRLAAGIAEASSVARMVGDRALETMALADLGLLLVTTGDADQGMRLLDEAMATTLGGLGPRLEVVVWSSCNMLAACSLVDDLRRAVQWCRAADTFMRTYGCPFLQARCRAHYGRVLVSSGDWGLAEAELQRALAMAEEVGRGPRAEARAALAELRLRQGRVEEAAHLLADLDGTSATAAVSQAGVDLALGRPAAALSALRAALDILDAHDPDVVSVTAALAEAYLAAGSVDDAEALLLPGSNVWEVAAYPRAAAMLRRAGGLLAAARGDHDMGRRQLAEALVRFTRNDLPFEAARTRLDLAKATLHVDETAAVAHATFALRSFERLGAAGEAAEAGAVLRSLGVATGPGPRDAHVLTRREREVLALVATGLSNPEIAARLFLSRRTVAHHVSRILAKLGLHSRSEAAAYAAREGASAMSGHLPTGPGAPDGRN